MHDGRIPGFGDQGRSGARTGAEITHRQIPRLLLGGEPRRHTREASGKEADVEAETRRSAEMPASPVVGPPPDRLLELERQHILRLLRETRGNRSETARRLGIERKTLYKKALRLGIDLHTAEKP